MWTKSCIYMTIVRTKAPNYENFGVSKKCADGKRMLTSGLLWPDRCPRRANLLNDVASKFCTVIYSVKSPSGFILNIRTIGILFGWSYWEEKATAISPFDHIGFPFYLAVLRRVRTRYCLYIWHVCRICITSRLCYSAQLRLIFTYVLWAWTYSE